MSNPVYRFASVSGQGLQWLLRRNCSVTPAQLVWMYAGLCAVSLSIGLWFWQMGAPLVLGFAGIEIVAVGAALWVYARHALDGERIVLQGQSLVVEKAVGGRLERTELDIRSLTVEPCYGEHSLIALSARGRVINVGRFVRPELRPALARELRTALRGS